MVHMLSLEYNSGMDQKVFRDIVEKCIKNFIDIKGSEKISNIPDHIACQIERIMKREGKNAKYIASIFIDDVLYLEYTMKGNWWNYLFSSQANIVIRDFEYSCNGSIYTDKIKTGLECAKFCTEAYQIGKAGIEMGSDIQEVYKRFIGK